MAAYVISHGPDLALTTVTAILSHVTWRALPEEDKHTFRRIGRAVVQAVVRAVVRRKSTGRHHTN